MNKSLTYFKLTSLIMSFVVFMSFDMTAKTIATKGDSCKSARVEMVQGIECILPKDLSSGEILYACEFINGAPNLPVVLGDVVNINYEAFTGSGCFSTCQQGRQITVGCILPPSDSCRRAKVEMVQGVECVLPKDLATGEILYPCEYIFGSTTLSDTIGKMAEITYEPFTGSGCFSTCLQGKGVSIGCTAKNNFEDILCIPCVKSNIEQNYGSCDAYYIAISEDCKTLSFTCEVSGFILTVIDYLNYETCVKDDFSCDLNDLRPYFNSKIDSIPGCINSPLDTCIFHPDYAPLMALYNSTSGSGWINNAGWQDGAAGKNCDPCNGWYGISCDSLRVTGVTLSNNNLNGSLPKEVGNLIELRNFVADNNDITGGIPSEIGNLSKLENLAIYDLKLNGEIPESFHNLKQIKYLSLNGNQLNGRLPEFLGSLSYLENLFLFNNNFSNGIPSSLGNLKNLKKLWLQNNNLSGCIPENILKLCSISELVYLENNHQLATQSWTNFCNNQEGMCTSNIIEKTIESIVIYPNPTTGIIHFDQDMSDVERIQILSLDGKVIIESKIINNQMDVSFLPPSLNLVVIHFNNGGKLIMKVFKI